MSGGKSKKSKTWRWRLFLECWTNRIKALLCVSSAGILYMGNRCFEKEKELVGCVGQVWSFPELDCGGNNKWYPFSQNLDLCMSLYTIHKFSEKKVQGKLAGKILES